MSAVGEGKQGGDRDTRRGAQREKTERERGVTLKRGKERISSRCPRTACPEKVEKGTTGAAAEGVALMGRDKSVSLPCLVL